MIRRLLAFALLLGAQAGWAAEEILRFVSDVRVHEDSSITVTETITVRAEGRNIRRGIFRDFPTEYRDAAGREVHVTFDVISTRRDGRTEPSHQRRQGNGVRLYLGASDVFLDPGTYSYEIVYRSRGQLGFFEGYDEIYWNATGNGWDFPIHEAIAVIRLPAAVPEESLRLAAYTGPQGATRNDYAVSVESPGVIRFRTTRPLGAREGLTVAVGFPKGLLDKPAIPTNWRSLVAPWLSGLGFIGVLLYYFMAWGKVGRDPRPGVIIPRYESPDGLSPAALRYILRMKYDTTCMAAALVNLAVKGALAIRQEGWFFNRRFLIRRIYNAPTGELAPGEEQLLQQFLGSEGEFEFDDENYRTVQRALKAHERALEREHQSRNFKLNSDKVAAGVVLSILVVAAVAFVGGIPLAVATAAALLIVNLLFPWLMKAPTPMGRKMMDKIEGLKLYLGVAEKDTFRDMDRPKTLEEFERLLPYAVALDCASTWVDKFEDVLKALEAAGQLEHRNWMTSTGHVSAGDVVKSVDSLASGFTSSISSASSPPGSSSGSGGGGSSGGGGGGGGGGGW